MNDKEVKMFLSSSGYKRFVATRIKLGFKTDDVFLKYAVLKTILPKLTKDEQKDARAEMKRLKEE